MKSETYQKEGWFILEEENSVFGLGADNTNKLDSEEKFSIYHNEDEANNNIDISSKELTDFVDSLIQDVPDLSEEEINRGVEKILAKAYPAEEAVKPSNNSKVKKVTLRVLFIAALLSAVIFSCIYVVGSSRNINIENGFVTFAKDAVKIVFFGNDEAESIDVKTLLEDLEAHGFSDIVLPQKLYDYMSSIPNYFKGVADTGANDTAVFSLSNNYSSYSFRLTKNDYNKLVGNYFVNLDDAETVIIDDIYIYVFEYDNGMSTINFSDGSYSYFIQSDVSLNEMINTAQTIIKTEE